MLTLSILESKFQKSNPFGTITKQSTNKYFVCYDSRDFRTEAEKEIDLWGATADKRKLYTYTAKTLTDLAYKLKIDVSEYEKKSKLNEEFEAMLKNTDYSEELELELFGE
jgi:hypothetical protein